MRRFFVISRFVVSLLALGFLGVNTADAKENPCREIAKVCRKSGYSKNGPRGAGQGLMRDCLQKVIAGQTLPGVQVKFETLSSCKQRWAAQQSRRSGEHRVARTSSSKKNGRRLASKTPPIRLKTQNLRSPLKDSPTKTTSSTKTRTH